MNFFDVKKLDDFQLKAVEALAQSCLEKDKNRLPYFPHIIKKTRGDGLNFLCYEACELIGFLSMFKFESNAFELILFVHPSYRNQGVGQQLLVLSHQTLKTLTWKKLIFPTVMDKKNCFLKSEFQYQETELTLCLRPQDYIKKTVKKIFIQKATVDDIDRLNDIHQTAFSENILLMKKRFHSLLREQGYHLYLAFKDGNPIGKMHLFIQGKKGVLSDVVIVPNVQKQGFGSALMQHALQICQTQALDYLSLEVEKSNHAAIALYKKVGFNIRHQLDYFTISRHDWENILQ